MTTWSLGRLEQIYVKPEATFGDGALPDAGDAIKHIDCEFSTDIEQVDREDRDPNSRSHSERLPRRTSGEWSINGNVIPSGSAATPPDIADLLEGSFDDGVTQSAATIFYCDESSGTISDGDAVALGDIMVIDHQDGNAYAVCITVKVGTALTWDPALPTAPSDGCSIILATNYKLMDSNAASLTILRHWRDQQTLHRGCKVNEWEFDFSGTEETKFACRGLLKDGLYAGSSVLDKPMKANYAFSQAGPLAAMPDATHKGFNISVAGDAAEEIMFSGTETTYLQLVNAANMQLLLFIGVNNKAAVAVLIGSGTGTGWYIRAGATGNGKDVVLTAVLVDDYSVTGALGAANGGYELDADEISISGYGPYILVAGLKVTVDDEIMTVLDVGTSITVTRGVAADHDVGDIMYPYAPTPTTVGVPAYGVEGWGGMLDGHIVSGKVTIKENVAMLNDIFGTNSAVDAVHPARRDVGLELELYLNDTSWYTYVFRRLQVNLGWMLQSGNEAGKIFAVYVRNVNFDIKDDLELPKDMPAKIKLTGGRALASSSGNDEVVIAFA